MSLSKKEIIEYYRKTLQEIEVLKKHFDIDSLRRKERQANLEKEINEKIKNGTATGLDHWMLYIKIDFFTDNSNPELDLLIEKARNLALKLYGEDVAFPTIKDFLIKSFKRLKKILKYLAGHVSYSIHSTLDKRPLISHFTKLLIKVNNDDVVNSITHTIYKVTRDIDFINYKHGNYFRCKKGNYRYFSM